MQPHPLQLPHYMLTFQGHEAFQIYLFNSAVLVVALWLSRVLYLSCSKRWPTGGVASSRTRPLTPLVGKFSKSKVGPKKKKKIAPVATLYPLKYRRRYFWELELDPGAGAVDTAFLSPPPPPPCFPFLFSPSVFLPQFFSLFPPYPLPLPTPEDFFPTSNLNL